jgi:hypothetical protein
MSLIVAATTKSAEMTFSGVLPNLFSVFAIKDICDISYQLCATFSEFLDRPFSDNGGRTDGV